MTSGVPGLRDLRVMVVDDSAAMRGAVSRAISLSPGVVVVGEATDGDDALKRVFELQPDLITLDLEMPRMDGFTFLRLLMAKRPTPVIIVSGFYSKENVFRALELGAVDFITKSPSLSKDEPSVLAAELGEKVRVVRQLSRTALEARRPAAPAPASSTAAVLTKLAAQRAGSGPAKPADSTRSTSSARALSSARTTDAARTPRSDGAPAPSETLLPRRVVLLGASTGGPAAIIDIVKKLPPAGSYAVIIAQHMPDNFTHGFAERLKRLGRVDFEEVREPRELRRGRGYVAPGGMNVEVRDVGGRTMVCPASPTELDAYVPSVDRLFETAAELLGRRAVAVVLTGMGDDGSRGVKRVQQAGGLVLAESESTAVVASMPEAAVRSGACDAILPLPLLGDRIREIIG